MVKLSCGGGDTVEDVITAALAKVNSSEAARVEAADVVLKATGFRDYMLDRAAPIVGYEYVQTCLRDNHEIKFTLVPAADPLERDAAWRRSEGLATEADDPQDAIDRGNALLPSLNGLALPLDEVQWPLRIRVHTVSAIQARRLEKKIEHGEETLLSFPLNVSKVFVKVALLFAGADLPGCAMETPERLPFAPHVRWTPASTLATELSLCNIPQQARIVLTLLAICPESVEAVRLAHVAVPLVDCFGRLLAGERVLRLWDPTVVRAARGGGGDACALRSRRCAPLMPARAQDVTTGVASQCPAPGAVEMRVEFDRFLGTVLASSASGDVLPRTVPVPELPIVKAGWLCVACAPLHTHTCKLS